MQPRILPTLLKRLKQLRKQKGLTQEQVAEKSGFSVKYYQMLESGKRPDMRLSTIERLATAFGISPADLLR